MGTPGNRLLGRERRIQEFRDPALSSEKNITQDKKCLSYGFTDHQFFVHNSENWNVFSDGSTHLGEQAKSETLRSPLQCFKQLVDRNDLYQPRNIRKEQTFFVPRIFSKSWRLCRNGFKFVCDPIWEEFLVFDVLTFIEVNYSSQVPFWSKVWFPQMDLAREITDLLEIIKNNEV